MDLLELHHVMKTYTVGEEPVTAVDDVTFSIRAGEMLALHGPSGSGKTTLLLLIASLLQPDSGEIRFDGIDVTALTEAQRSDYLSRDVGFVYQHLQLMPQVSALENAAMHLMIRGVGMRRAQEAALPWLERIGLGKRLRHTPEQLSTGERQRVAIVRALAGNPRLVLADEPTGNLDSVASAEVVRMLRSVAHDQNAAVLLVTHDIEAAEIADRHLTIRDGRLSEAMRLVRESTLLTGATGHACCGPAPGAAAVPGAASAAVPGAVPGAASAVVPGAVPSPAPATAPSTPPGETLLVAHRNAPGEAPEEARAPLQEAQAPAEQPRS